MGTQEDNFATFGPEVDAATVPTLVGAGLTVWSFGYGDDEDEFTVITEGDLWAWDTDPDVVASWGPFRLEVGPAAEPQVVEPRHTVRGKTSEDGWAYGVTHDMDCPACVASGSSFTTSPRSETYWSS